MRVDYEVIGQAKLKMGGVGRNGEEDFVSLSVLLYIFFYFFLYIASYGA